ncbi:MAG: ATP-binding protein, partial [Candidatus Woesearchaeota archaeon]|nr:ATP-binding protein [Candidatus Woesearchaeota archaeon]
EEEEGQRKFPLVWLVVDEAHEFIPRQGKTLASDPLITILREGRQPGISLILASQQPGKIHTDVMTQSDIVISHRITAKIDIDALGMLMQSYMRMGLDKVLNNLPRVSGAAIIFDDTNERMYPMRIRPRVSWHGGASPSAVEVKEKTFEF